MFDPLIQLARYTRDLLGVDESIIKLGRDNFDNTDFSQPLIVVDTLTTAPQYSNFNYDNVAEQRTHTVNILGDFTLNFYGSDALTQSSIWVTMNTSEAGRQLQQLYEIQIYRGTSVNNLRWLAGAQYNNRFEVSVRMRYNIEHTSSVLRIDTAQLDDFLINK